MFGIVIPLELKTISILCYPLCIVWNRCTFETEESYPYFEILYVLFGIVVLLELKTISILGDPLHVGLESMCIMN